ncbi:S1/P1 nuclease [Massilia sp. CF038]|uniref:S1/P1 nuclease n=1 Tax=Massilia sp. CF038 TaxID=1881045 RepID=UPI000920B372|nr:S1/P1 nuclease [Massilia sp. CF038]SHH24055.1 S1/P1 Nuclease [Massilia sp. CF038]
MTITFNKGKRMNKLAAVVALSCAFVSIDAAAWGNEGHRAVGAIAEKLIKGSNAEKEVAALLLPGETLESITNWADSAKGGVGYPAATPEQVVYTTANPRHTEYHYANVPFQATHYHEGIVGSAEVDIVQSLKQAIAVLQGKTDPEFNPHQFTRRQALLLVAHLVGDIHQPLHMGSAYVSAEGQFVYPQQRAQVDGVHIFETLGSNSLLLDNDKLASIEAPLNLLDTTPLPPDAKKWATKPFHSYWDATVVKYAMRRSTTSDPAAFAQKMIDSNPEVPKNTGRPYTWPTQWADDTLAASKFAYQDVTVGKPEAQVNKRGATEYKFALQMGANYPVSSSALARTQLVNGGYHLASLLQAIWP